MVLSTPCEEPDAYAGGLKLAADEGVRPRICLMDSMSLGIVARRNGKGWLGSASPKTGAGFEDEKAGPRRFGFTSSREKSRATPEKTRTV